MYCTSITLHTYMDKYNIHIYICTLDAVYLYGGGFVYCTYSTPYNTYVE